MNWSCPYFIIPRFHFANKRNCCFNKPIQEDEFTFFLKEQIEAKFHKLENYNSFQDFFKTELTIGLLQWPSLLTELIIKKITKENDFVCLDSFVTFWKEEIAPFDRSTRLFRLLKKAENNYLFPDDLVPLIEQVVALFGCSELLQLKQSNPRKFSRYILSVISRFFYWVNTSRSGQISSREFRLHSKLEKVLLFIDRNGSISQERKYFSFNDFLVADHNFHYYAKEESIYIRELQKYQKYAVTPVIINR